MGDPGACVPGVQSCARGRDEDYCVSLGHGGVFSRAEFARDGVDGAVGLGLAQGDEVRHAWGVWVRLMGWEGGCEADAGGRARGSGGGRGTMGSRLERSDGGSLWM